MGELFAVLFRFLIIIFLGVMVRSVFRSVVAGFRSAAVPPQPTRQSPPALAGGDLKKDPVCGTYVSPAVSQTRIVNGETFYFCSKECRDQYRPN